MSKVHESHDQTGSAAQLCVCGAGAETHFPASSTTLLSALLPWRMSIMLLRGVGSVEFNSSTSHT